MSDEQTAQELLEEIKKLSHKIYNIQRKFDDGTYRGYEQAGNLQKLKRDRKVLMSKLPGFVLIEHPDPTSLEPFFKRTRAEVREFMGLEFIPGTESVYL